MNENEMREKIHLIQLGILGILEDLTNAHTELLMRRFNDCQRSLGEVIRQARDALPMIPEETDD